MIWNSDTWCSRGYRPSHNTFYKVYTQGSSHKNLSRFKESKSKDLKSAPPRDDTVELDKKEGKRKKRSRRQRRERTKDQKKHSPAIGVNTKAPKKKIRARCFNWNKKNHYANDYIEPP